MTEWRWTRLLDIEDEIAELVGARRFKNRHEVKGRDGLGEGPSKDEYTPALAIRGVKHEIACAKLLNVYWAPIVEFRKREPDVGGLVEVRSIRESWHRLIVKPWEENAPFALMWSDGDRYEFRGWEMAEAVRAKGTFHEYPNTDPGHYAKQHQLRPIEELEAMIPPHRCHCGKYGTWGITINGIITWYCRDHFPK